MITWWSSEKRPYRGLAYIAFCLLNTVIYSFPAHWVWADQGWLKQMHVVDVAGVGPVHLVGGVTALVAAIIVKPLISFFLLLHL
jgi:ammonia channel protein AmtB